MGFFKSQRAIEAGGSHAKTLKLKGPVIGIDLGTTYSCVAVFQHGRAEIVANDHGNRITPSCVAFTDRERLIGDAAKQQALYNPTNTVFDAKRLIGRKYDDPVIANDVAHWPFKVLEEEGKPKIEVIYKDKVKVFSPEEISAMVLHKMKLTAEAYLGVRVYEAVVTVPAYFNDAQRQATKDSGTIAGLNVLRIINEPTAAAIAYGLDEECSRERRVLIYDLGGGTFDVSVLSISDGIFEVKSTAGDTHLGGADFDNAMVDYLVTEFNKHHNTDLTQNSRTIMRLKIACERAKIELSSRVQTIVHLDNICDGVDIHINMSRAKFEDVNAPLFRKTLDCVKMALDDAGLAKSDIDDVVLVGGSTRIPKIRKMITEFFEGFLGGKVANINTDINPDEAIAYGAAVQGAILSGQRDEQVESMLLLDVIPLSLGIETVGGCMTVLIKKNSTIPARTRRMFTTFLDNQTHVIVQIYEGERMMTVNNNLLGEFHLSGITPLPRGLPEIEVSFNIDANGILEVTASDIRTGNTRSITITNKKGRLTDKEIKMMVKDAEKFKSDDDWRHQKAKIQNFISWSRVEDQSTVPATMQPLPATMQPLPEGEVQVVDDALEASQQQQ